MNVYVESNFVLELSLFQEEYQYCEQILSLCESGKAKLIIPAYSLAEPNETLIRRDRSRKQLARELQLEFGQLSRSATNTMSVETFQAVLSLLILSGETQKQRLDDIRARLLQSTEIIPLNGEILETAASYEKQYALSPQDAFVFASVLQRLKTDKVDSCFLTRNSEDFNTTGVRALLTEYRCKLLFSFSDGLGYMQRHI